ncbi:MAG: SDR family NAD(P)-dependent oxidoreductase [bacterium JZ-2024 1]
MEGDWAGKRVAITGGMGFIGSNLAHKLVELGAEVTILDNMHPDYGANEFNLEGIRDRVRIIKGDVRSEADVSRAVSGRSVIYHLAAQVSHLDSMINPYYDLDVNARGTLTVLESCRREAPGARFVYGGTRGQYGKIFRLPVDEDHPTFPVDVYGANKEAGELYTLVYSHAFGLEGVCLRINNTYGERHQMKHGKYGILNWFIRLALEAQTIQIFGDGKQLRDYNYVGDVVDALLLVGIAPNLRGKVYNLGSGEPIEFREMVRKIIEKCGSGSYEFAPYPEERKRIEVGDFVADFRRIKMELGWSPKTPFDEGLSRTVEFYKQYGAHYW